MLRNILAIAKNTFRETMRDRIVLAACALVLLLIAFSLYIGAISIDQNIRMIVDFGLTSIYILQIFIAIFIGSMLIYKEIERKTFFLLLPKPVKIEAIILGKCLGLTATTTVVTAISTIALYGILYYNGGNLFFVPILVSVLLSILESSILILISMLFSGMTSPILSAVYTVAFYLIGHSSDIYRMFFYEMSPSLKLYVLQAAYYVLPNLEKFNIRNDVIYEKLPTPHVLFLTVLYALCYGLIIFLLTKLNFRKKEF
jgi:ABC-type transport system involved in multi-copper enzyme maturation permease subunit